MEKLDDLKIELHETEERLLTELRTLRRGLRGIQDGSQADDTQLTIGQRIADAVAATMGLLDIYHRPIRCFDVLDRT